MASDSELSELATSTTNDPGDTQSIHRPTVPKRTLGLLPKRDHPRRQAKKRMFIDDDETQTRLGWDEVSVFSSLCLNLY